MNKDKQLKDLWNSYKSRAKRDNITFSLTFGEFEKLVTQDCSNCGRDQLRVKNEKMYPGLTGIDRIDNNGGYTLDNCSSFCFRCNKYKSDEKMESFEMWTWDMIKFQIIQKFGEEAWDYLEKKEPKNKSFYSGMNWITITNAHWVLCEPGNCNCEKVQHALDNYGKIKIDWLPKTSSFESYGSLSDALTAYFRVS